MWWQAVNRNEPLVPLCLFSDRNFSISNFAISTMSFTATSMGFPLMLYAQLVRGLSPTEAALLMVPMAAVSIVMAPIVGRYTDRVHPRVLTGFGFAFTAASILWLSRVMTPDSATWEILLPMALLGFGMAGIWAPLAATATRNLPLRMAGAGAGRLQRHPPGRGRARLGGDRGAHGQPPGRPGTDRRSVRRGHDGSAARAAAPARSATPWRSPCCCPRRCWCSAWCR